MATASALYYALLSLLLGVPAGAVSFFQAGGGAGTAAAAVVERSRQNARLRQPVSPKLDPKSHKEFFERDYPDDLKPSLPKDFNMKQPYPHIQEEEQYDVDLVRDENGDGGEWKAQMRYDKLKNLIQREQSEVAEATEVEEQRKKELDEVEKEAEASESNATKAEAAAEKAEAKAQKASEREENADAAVADAEEEVQKEASDLEDCQRQLNEAKAKLKKAEEEKALREAAARRLAAEMNSSAAAGDEADLAAAREQASESKAEHGRALKSYEEEVAELSAAEEAFKKAEERLAAARTMKVAHHEAIPLQSHSGAATITSASWRCLGVVTVFLAVAHER